MWSRQRVLARRGGAPLAYYSMLLLYLRVKNRVHNTEKLMTNGKANSSKPSLSIGRSLSVFEKVKVYVRLGHDINGFCICQKMTLKNVKRSTPGNSSWPGATKSWTLTSLPKGRNSAAIINVQVYIRLGHHVVCVCHETFLPTYIPVVITVKSSTMWRS